MLTPYLFVGLGGSGGKTLQYLKHFLQTRLDQVDYQGEFPKGWKFIWFDVPTSQDLLDSDLGILSSLFMFGVLLIALEYI